MLLGYNTNGFPHHDLVQAIDVLGEMGYQSIAITLDHGGLNPYALEYPRVLDATRDALRRNAMRCVIETGARYLLDPRVKHEPTLMTPDADGRRRRVDFLRHAVTIAADLQADCVSLWSGILRDDAADSLAWGRLLEGLTLVCDWAARHDVVIGFEPEPGMFIDTMAQFAELRSRLNRPELQLTLDVGHLHCLGETPIADVIHRWGPHIVNVHIEDMRRGVHDHLPFGEGEMCFPPILAALREEGYTGGLHVELSRHGHDAPHMARLAHTFLRTLLK